MGIDRLLGATGRRACSGASVFVDSVLLEPPARGPWPPTGVLLPRLGGKRGKSTPTANRGLPTNPGKPPSVSLVGSEEPLAVEVDQVGWVVGAPDFGFPGDLRQVLAHDGT